jgi:streptogrisin D
VVSALVMGCLVVGWAVAGPAAPTALAALAAVNALPPTPNTAWGIDPASGQLLVTVSSAAPAAGAAKLVALAQRLGSVISVEHTDRSFTEQGLLDTEAPSTVYGGDQISDGHLLCSSGFNLVKDGQPYLLTAGHCTADMTDWQGIGPAVVSEFPETDYGLIRNDSATAPGDIDLYNGKVQAIRSIGKASVGQAVCASGHTTKVTCGKVTAVNQTVDYGDGNVVRGLIKTNVHTDHGDSGGPLFDGAAGIGVVSGGDGRTDYFQPLATAATAYHLTLAAP